MIRPIIEYCSGVWACCGEVNNGNLERLQNRGARTVAQTPSSSSALSYLKWQSLNSRRNNNIFKLVEKSLNGECPQYFMNYFSFNKDVILRTTRQSNLLHLPSVRTETTKRAFYYHGCTVFIILLCKCIIVFIITFNILHCIFNLFLYVYIVCAFLFQTQGSC